jgi:hypothetical protein
MKKLWLLALLFTAQAHAEFYTGNEILEACKSENYFNRGLCAGYVAGAFDVMQGVSHCAPASVTAGQVRDVFIKALEAAPELRHQTADRLAHRVFKSLWPCANNTGARTL